MMYVKIGALSLQVRSRRLKVRQTCWERFPATSVSFQHLWSKFWISQMRIYRDSTPPFPDRSSHC